MKLETTRDAWDNVASYGPPFPNNVITNIEKWGFSQLRTPHEYDKLIGAYFLVDVSMQPLSSPRQVVIIMSPAPHSWHRTLLDISELHMSQVHSIGLIKSWYDPDLCLEAALMLGEKLYAVPISGLVRERLFRSNNKTMQKLEFVSRSGRIVPKG